MEFQITWAIITNKRWKVSLVRYSLLSKEAGITYAKVWEIRMVGEITEPKQSAQNYLTVAYLETILAKSNRLPESFSRRWQTQLRKEASLATRLIQDMKDIFSDSTIRFIVEKVSDVPGADFVVNQWLQLAVLLSWNSLITQSIPYRTEEQLSLARRLLRLSSLLMQSGLEIQAMYCNAMKPFITNLKKLRRLLKQYKVQITTNQELLSIFPYPDVTVSRLAVIVQRKETKAPYTISVAQKVITVEWQAGPNQSNLMTSSFSLEGTDSTEVATPLLESILKHTLDRLEDVRIGMNSKLPEAKTVGGQLLTCMKSLVSHIQKQDKQRRIRISACSVDTRRAIILVEMSLKDLYTMLQEIICNVKRVVGVADILHSKISAGNARLGHHSALPIYSNSSLFSPRWPWTFRRNQKVQRTREEYVAEADYLLSHTLLSKHANYQMQSISCNVLVSPELLKQLLLRICKDANSEAESAQQSNSSSSRCKAERDFIECLTQGPLWKPHEAPSRSTVRPIKSTFHYVNPSFSKMGINLNTSQLKKKSQDGDSSVKSADIDTETDNDHSAQLHEDVNNKDNMHV